MMERRIEEFVMEHHLLTFAAAGGSDIWCASAFYAYCADEKAFVITSDEATRHISLAVEGGAAGGNEYPLIAGNIALETEKVGMIRGLQFKAELVREDEKYFNKYRALYLKRFPYAVLKGGELWVLRVVEAKFTDNRLGFGKKLYWRRGEDETAQTAL